MTDTALQEILARAEAATLGPWQSCPRRTDGPHCVYADDNVIAECEGFAPEVDAPFIAAARTDVPALVQHVRNLQSELDAMNQNCAFQLEEIKRLRGEVESLRSTLTVIASHDPSWSDDFCRARAVLGMKP